MKLKVFYYYGEYLGDFDIYDPIGSARIYMVWTIVWKTMDERIRNE
jgi:hypothetical protein